MSERWRKLLRYKLRTLPGCSRKEGCSCPARNWLEGKLADTTSGVETDKKRTPQRWHDFLDRKTVDCQGGQKPKDAEECYRLIGPGLKRRSFGGMKVTQEGRGISPSKKPLSPGGFIRGWRGGRGEPR